MPWLDGVYLASEDGAHFVGVAAPTTTEVADLVAEVSGRVERWLSRRGYGSEADSEEDEEDASPVWAASLAGRVALGSRAGRKTRRLRHGSARAHSLPPRCAESGGYNLHGGVVVSGSDRDALERLCRYVNRPAVAMSRLERRPDGLIALQLRRAYTD